jgi:hypothetical protein
MRSLDSASFCETPRQKWITRATAKYPQQNSYASNEFATRVAVRSPEIQRRPDGFFLRHQRSELADTQHDGRKTVAVSEREDVADEQRVIAAVMPRRHRGGDGGVGMCEYRRVAGVFVFRLEAFDRPPGEMSKSQ